MEIALGSLAQHLYICLVFWRSPFWVSDRKQATLTGNIAVMLPERCNIDI